MDDLIAQLRKRIAELEAENAELRRRLEQLEHDLQKVVRAKLRGDRLPLPLGAATETS
jgi:cell division protein FtsB